MQTFPIWEYATDEEDVEGQDESWVRPVAATKIPAKAYSQIAATSFRTRGGQQYSGFMIVSPAASTPALLDHSGGALFSGRDQCFLVDLNGPALSFIKRDCLKDIKSALRMDPAEIFPLTFELLVLISGEEQLRRGAFEAQKNA